MFNTQGKALYAGVGKPGGERADVGLDMLIPASLRKSQEIDYLPWATLQESVALGGEARLTATSVAEQQKPVENVVGVEGVNS